MSPWISVRSETESDMTEGKSLIGPRNTLLGTDFDQMFNRMMRGWPPAWPETPASGDPRPLRVFDHAPKVEVKENGKMYSIDVELPGLDEKDLKVQIEDDVLTVSGEKKVEKADEKTH